MTEEDYKILCMTCDSLLLEDNARYETIAIPWLHVMREHPIFLRQYESLFTTSSICEDIKSYFYRTSKRVAQCLRLTWNLLRFPSGYWIGGEVKPYSYDVIFVSHLINVSQLSAENDFYYDKLPQDLIKSGNRVLLVLVNHTSLPIRALNRGINSLVVPRVVVPEFLPVREEFKIWWRTKKQSNRFLQSEKIENNEFRKKVLKKSAIEASSQATKITLRIAISIGEIVKNSQAKAIITTYEGHAWERLLFAKARDFNQDIKCIAYQHAAMFRLQHSAKRSVGAPYDPEIIMTSGPVGLKQLKGSKSLAGIKFGILGSNRSVVISQRSFSSACLVLPEGIAEECIKLFSFSLKCAKVCPDIHFIWRLHPIFDINVFASCGIDLESIPPNVEISVKNFEVDIARSKWALYRGSTAIITAAANGVVPIYLAQAGELSIDPLYEMDSHHPSISEVSQFLNAVEETVLSPKLKEYCTQFYKPFNVSILAEELALNTKN